MLKGQWSQESIEKHGHGLMGHGKCTDPVPKRKPRFLGYMTGQGSDSSYFLMIPFK